MFDQFVLDPATGVRVRAVSDVSVPYLDGNEASLGELFGRCRDLSSASDELLSLASTWPLRYHVSPHRWAVLDALGLPGNARHVLELGAGCGAITRWLGENFAEVRAVEGSLVRAALARRRTADLGSVEVYSANFMSLTPEPVFDLVTMIGVLEYSPVFHPDPEATAEQSVIDNLRVGLSALTDAGAMVIAIENRVGAKYLFGAAEDHTGTRWEGVEGYPRSRTPITFAPSHLESLILRAGFDRAVTLSVWPDYKLPRTLANPACIAGGDRLHNWIAMGSGIPGRSNAGPSAALAERELVRAGVATALANSLVVLAVKGPPTTLETLGMDLTWSIRHYALHRRSAFRKRLTLRGEPAARELVTERPGNDAGPVDVAGVTQDLSTEVLRHGDLLVFDVLSAVAASGPVPTIAAHAARFRTWLLERHAAPDAEEHVRGDAFDLTWWNVLVDPATGEWREIDREWSLGASLPVDLVVWRMLCHFATHFADSLPAGLPPKPAAFATAVLATIPGARADLAREFRQLDRAAALAIAPSGPPVPVDCPLAALRAAAARPAPLTARVAIRVLGHTAMTPSRGLWFADRGTRALRNRLRVRRAVRGRPGK